ncbi:MAG: response regulator [Cyanobacteriota bacterium]|nr:response regulator [Cyanobacteriota bacterium]
MSSNPPTTHPEVATSSLGSPDSGGLRARILIVDDSYMVAEMLSSFLGKQGCTISYALDGSAALDQVRQQPPDLIIADWVMPTLDGLSLCRQLRKTPEYSWIYYIIMTAREGNDNMDRALEAGADEFLSKPFQAAELMTRVRAGLRIVELRRQQLKAAHKVEGIPGLPNAGLPTIGTRQTLIATLPVRIQQTRKLNEPLSLFILRLANLGQLSKALNESSRQELLEGFTNRLIHNLREEDDLFCYDEGQYIVILTATTLPAAQIAVERCCQRMVQQPFVIQAQPVEVQIQFGTANLTESDDPQGRALLMRAAQVMRDSKNQPSSLVVSPLTAVSLSSSEQELQERVKALEIQNQELRLRLEQLSHLEAENQALKQQLEQFLALQPLEPSP